MRFDTYTVRYDCAEFPITAIVGDHITKTLEAGAFYELDLLEAIAALKRPGTYVDVGAHVGNHSVWFATHCPSSRVVAFEPNVVAFAALSQNAARYTFEAQPVAIHDEWRYVRIEDTTPGNHGMAKVVRAADIGAADAGARAIALDNTQLYLVGVGLIKIDVEGQELSVLRSGTALILRDRPVIVTEAQTGTELQALERHLGAFGYKRHPGVFAKTPTYIWLP